MSKSHPLPELLLATNNPGKLEELQAILAQLNLEAQLMLPEQLGLQLEVIEDGQTYAENAARKVLAFAQASGLPTLADDSGLEVDALDGRPGLYSARYSPLPNATDADRRHHLLENLTGHPRPWTARFRCVIALLDPRGAEVTEEQIEYAEGACPGEIIPQERGHNGFGYDPVFFLPELGKTMAELPSHQKNRLSHRARAVQNAYPILKRMLLTPPSTRKD